MQKAKKAWVVTDYKIAEYWVFTEEDLAIEFRDKYIDSWIQLTKENELFPATQEERETSVVIQTITINPSLENCWVKKMLSKMG